jgi:hypothetical protein
MRWLVASAATTRPAMRQRHLFTHVVCSASQVPHQEIPMNTKTRTLVPLSIAIAACLFAAGCHNNVRDADETGMQSSTSTSTTGNGQDSTTTTTSTTTTGTDSTTTTNTQGDTTQDDSGQDTTNPPTSP